MPISPKNIARIKAALSGNFERVRPALKKLHPYDIAKILEEVSPETRERIIKVLPPEMASEALSEMDEETDPAGILRLLSPEQAAQIIEGLDPDDAADILAQLPPNDLRKIMYLLPDEEEKVIETLMTYGEDTAGGIMNPEVFKLNSTLTKKSALRRLLEQSEDMEDFYVIYVVDDMDRLSGIVSLKELLRSGPQATIGDLGSEKLIYVHVDADQEEAAKMMQQYNLPALPVVDDELKLLGRITFDDVMDVIEEESTEDILKIAGVSEGEELRGSWGDAVKSRLPWLAINLVTASTAGLVISLFNDVFEKIVVISSFMPIIAGVAGNGATQTLAVTIRRIATDGIPTKEYLSVILKEFAVGLTNGFLIGAVVSLIAFWTNNEPKLGIVVFFAMVGNLVIAGLAGSSIPIFLERIGVDPAVASSILITAFTDILGYTLLLGLGAWMFL